MRPEDRDPREQSYFYDGQDSVIRDEPYEPTGEMAYREKSKRAKKSEKKSKCKK